MHDVQSIGTQACTITLRRKSPRRIVKRLCVGTTTLPHPALQLNTLLVKQLGRFLCSIFRRNVSALLARHCCMVLNYPTDGYK